MPLLLITANLHKRIKKILKTLNQEEDSNSFKNIKYFFRKNNDIHIEQTKTKPQGSLEFKTKKQRETFFPFSSNKPFRRRKIAISSNKLQGNQPRF